MLNKQIADEDSRHREQLLGLQDFCSCLGETLELLKRKLLMEQLESQQREKDLAALQQYYQNNSNNNNGNNTNNLLPEELGTDQQQSINNNNYNNNDPLLLARFEQQKTEIESLHEELHHVRQHSDKLQSELVLKSEEGGKYVDQINKLLNELNTLKQEKEVYREKQERLSEELRVSQEDVWNKHQTARTWESNCEELKDTVRDLNNQLSELKSNYEQQFQQRSSLQRNTDNVQGEIIDKEYQVDTLNEKLRYLEEQLRDSNTLSEQLNAKIRLQQEEISAKDNLLKDKFTIKLPQQGEEEGGLYGKLFGNRTDFLEKQLILSKKASLAHQTHNSFLHMEVIISSRYHIHPPSIKSDDFHSPIDSFLLL